MLDLTPPQLAVFQFLELRHLEGLAPPSMREICKEMGYGSTKAAHDVVAALEKKGWIARHEGKARSIRLVKRSAGGIPVIGSIAAGLAQDESETGGMTLHLDPQLFGIPANHQAFALRVRGDSMTGRFMFDGDWVVCDANAEPRTGNVVVALIDQESTLKTMVSQRGKVWLKAENPAYPELYPASSLTIQGVALGVIRSIAA